MYQMTLQEIIDVLSHQDPKQTVTEGFGEGYSYRGRFDEIAFPTVRNTTVGEMLQAAKAMDGKACGSKNGDYVMTLQTLCNLAEPGMCGSDEEDNFTRERLDEMLGR